MKKQKTFCKSLKKIYKKRISNMERNSGEFPTETKNDLFRVEHPFAFRGC